MHLPDANLLLNVLLSERPAAGSPADEAATAAITALIDEAQAHGVPPRLALAALLSRSLQIVVFEESTQTLSRRLDAILTGPALG